MSLTRLIIGGLVFDLPPVVHPDDAAEALTGLPDPQEARQLLARAEQGICIYLDVDTSEECGDQTEPDQRYCDRHTEEMEDAGEETSLADWRAAIADTEAATVAARPGDEPLVTLVIDEGPIGGGNMTAEKIEELLRLGRDNRSAFDPFSDHRLGVQRPGDDRWTPAKRPPVREEQSWEYPGNVPSARPLRVWQTGPNSVLAMVSDRPGDEGTSTTNAAEQIVAKLQAEHPGQHVEVIEHLVRPDVFGGGVEYHRIEVGPDGSSSWTPVKAAELAARLGPGFAGDTPPAPVAPVMSPEPILPNGWGGASSKIYFHDDGVIGQTLRGMGQDRHLQVPGGALANVLGRLATAGVNGELTAQQVVDSVKEVRDQVPPGTAARRALVDAVTRLDAPQTPRPPVPDSTPKPLRQLVNDLHAIPLVRRDPSVELEPLLQLIRDQASKESSWLRLVPRLRRLANRHHESAEGKFAIDAAIETAEEELREFYRSR